MKIGILTTYSKEDVDFLAEQGFGSCELLVPQGSPLAPSSPGYKAALDEAKAYLAEKNVEVSAVGVYHCNALDPDPAKAEANAAHIASLISVCQRLGVRDLCCFAGRDPEKDVLDNIPAFKKAFTPIVRRVEDAGLRLSFENCPTFHSFPFRGVNIAYNPEAWDAMFEAIPSDSMGIEYDPSHLIGMLMDPVQAIYDYGEKIFHVHAKDGEVVWRVVRRNGFYAHGAFRFRTPGLGQVNWKDVISALVEVGYRGNLDIEGLHDPVYKDDLELAGLLIAKKHLEQFVV